MEKQSIYLNSTEPHYQYSPKTKQKIEFFDRFDKKTVEVLAFGSLPLAIVDWQSALGFICITFVMSHAQYLGLKWTTRFDDKDAVWIGPDTGSLQQKLHIEPIGPPDKAKK